MLFQTIRCRRVLFLATAMILAVPLSSAAQPPKDFAGKRYINASGCVMEGKGSRWKPRLLPDGTPDCGYPPTPFGSSVPAGKTAGEDAILSQIGQAERRGDLIGLPKDRVPRPPSTLKDVSSELAAALSPQAGFMKGNLVLDHRNSQLCDLLGQGDNGSGGLGDDPTRGFCSGSAPDLKWAEKRVKAEVTPQSKAPSPTSTPKKTLAGPVSSTSGKPVVAAAKPKPPSAGRQVTEAMIPAGARYLVVGSYADMAGQMIKIHDLGLPLAKAKLGKGDAESLLVGPFSSRQAIVKAYDMLKLSGFKMLEPF